jgi:hypothetical protein
VRKNAAVRREPSATVHAETRRKSNLPPSALSAPPREKKSRRHLSAFSFPNVRFSTLRFSSFLNFSFQLSAFLQSAFVFRFQLSVFNFPFSTFRFSSPSPPRPPSPETRPRKTHPVGKAAPVAGGADPGFHDWPPGHTLQAPATITPIGRTGPVPTGCGASASHTQTNASLDPVPCFPRFLVEMHQLSLYMCIFE